MTKKNATKFEKEHMAKVKQQPCIVCDNFPVDVHHTGTHMGGGRNHLKVLPLCKTHHTGDSGIHALSRRVWQEIYGTEEYLMLKLQHKLDGVFT